MRVVVALGGNALQRRGEAMTADNQRANVKVAAEQLAAVTRLGHNLVMCHGNGPQVGLWACKTTPTPATSTARSPPIRWMYWVPRPKA
jgi:carbamate kinase